MNTANPRAPLTTTIALLAIVGAFLCTSGCASTKMRSFPDPDFAGHEYRCILIAAQLKNLDQKADAEEIFVDEFSDLDMTCIRSLDVLLPTREYADEDLFDILKEHHVDGVLVVRETEYYEEEKYIPESSTTTTNSNLSATTFYYGGTAYTQGTGRGTSHTSKSGGYYVRKPRVRHHVELYDVKSRSTAWVGAAFTKGNSKAKFKHLIESLAEETAKTFVEVGFADEREEKD